MKIVFDNIVYSLQKAGGISVVWQELTSRFLNKSNDDIMFIEHDDDKRNIFRQLINIPSSLIHSVHPMSLALDRYCNPRIKNSIPFIFHSSYFRLCKSKKAINVSTIHDFTYDYFYKGKRIGAFLHLWQRNYAIRKSDAVVCISENTRKDLLKFVPNVDTSKLYVIHNGVSDDYKILPEEEKINEYSEYLLFVGHRVAYKNGKFFINSIKETEYKVVFCGPKLTDEEITYLDKTLGKERYVSFSGLSNKELNRLYNSCKCLVYPSSYEGFGIPVLEAQAAGCPVIALNASSIPEIIGETPLLMNELSSRELLEKIDLLQNHEQVKTIINSGIENAKKYSWDSIYEQYRNLYQKLLNEKF